jgi:hypothetical protein
MLIGMALWTIAQTHVVGHQTAAVSGEDGNDDVPYWLQMPLQYFGAYLASMVLLCAVEASTMQIDNLVLPPLYFTLTTLVGAHFSK